MIRTCPSTGPSYRVEYLNVRFSKCNLRASLLRNQHQYVHSAALTTVVCSFAQRNLLLPWIWIGLGRIKTRINILREVFA